jgi:hypothetical protein
MFARAFPHLLLQSQNTPEQQPLIFVFMISPDKRDKKPYAIPIQCIPYRGMKDTTLRRLTSQIVHEMHHRKMVGSELFCHQSALYNYVFKGCVTNGEFNSFRAQGYQRPVSIFKIRANARSKYRSKGEATLLAMITPRSKLM